MNLKATLKLGKSLFKNSYYVKCREKKPVNPRLILLESKKGADVGGNILRLALELAEQYPDHKVYLAMEKRLESQASRKLALRGGEEVKLVEYYSFQYFELLATAGYLVTDTGFCRQFIKRPGQIYMNTWHGTSFKKLGKDIPAAVYAIGNIQRNFLMTDYLVSPSSYAIERLKEAYSLGNLYQGTYVYAGYPRNQVFYNEKLRKPSQEKCKKKYERIYCYMPTWRGTVADNCTGETREKQAKVIKGYLDRLDQELNEKEVLFVRLHPFVGSLIDYREYRHIEEIEGEDDPYEILEAADCLITDYSSVFFDYANRRDGKIILFLYDRKDFQEERDFYLKPEELPFPVTETAEELIKELRSPKGYDDTAFRAEYCPFDGPDAARILCRLLIEGKESEGLRLEKARGNGKKNLLFYVGSLKRNGLTTSYLNLMENIDRSGYNYYAAFQEEYLEKCPSRTDLLPDFVHPVPMSKGWFLTFGEAFASIFYYYLKLDLPLARKYLKRFYKREYDRNFGFGKFDWCIHFSGYEKKVISLFQEAPGKRAIFVHNDMLMEAKTRGNQHLPTLQEAYCQYDVVAAVSEDIYDRTLLISGKEENLHVVHNCHAYRQVQEKAEQALVFDETTRCTCSKEELEEIMKGPMKKFITIGRFSPEKGHEMLLQAFSLYQKDFPDSVLIIIGGGGNLYENTAETVEKLGLKKNVILVRSIQNPMPVLKACDLFILSSLYEGLGLVLLEADTLGLPVISTDVTGPRGFMREHGGYLVPPTAEGLYQGMKAFDRGEVPVLHVDYEDYNKKAVREFTELL
ncbi:MAG: glycosyltransferase [Eubacteriales bacterium]|nr:glycosyltransferase [Eubacteriales bacterium]